MFGTLAMGVDKVDPNSYECNEELVKSMLFDALVTHDFEKLKSPRARGLTP